MTTCKDLFMVVQILFGKRKSICQIYMCFLNSKDRSVCLIPSWNVFFLFEFYSLLKTLLHFSLHDTLKAVILDCFYLLEFLIAPFIFLWREHIYVFITVSLLYFSLLVIFVSVLDTFCFVLKLTESYLKPLSNNWTMGPI